MRTGTALSVILLATSLPCISQEVMSIEAYRSIGHITDLDTLYMSGVDVDSTRAAFGDRQDEFMRNYSGFYKELDAYLVAHGFAWDDTTRCFNKLYFHPDGKMDKYLYGFRSKVPPEKQLRFESLATDFLKDYRFPMTNPVPFRQCGPCTFVPKATGPKAAPDP